MKPIQRYQSEDKSKQSAAEPAFRKGYARPGGMAQFEHCRARYGRERKQKRKAKRFRRAQAAQNACDQRRPEREMPGITAIP